VSLETKALFSIADKTVLLTGASGYLGRTFARTVLVNGARLVALGRSEGLQKQVADWRTEFGAERVRGERVDMYDLAALGSVLDRVLEEEPFVEVLVNNAHELAQATGFNTPEGSLENAPIDQWLRNLTAGLCWPALTVQKLGSAMKARRRGSIINVSTMYALVAPSPRLYEGTDFTNPPGYSASKAGLVAFTRYVASYWGSYGIRANALLPGPFSNTKQQGPNAVPAGSEFLDRLASRTCLGRVGRAEELAGALLFLASDASSYVTGQALLVDGGWTTT
jgi:gluconate 5-dehydrogenase